MGGGEIEIVGGLEAVVEDGGREGFADSVWGLGEERCKGSGIVKDGV